jgi:hypothetical protein
VARPAQMGGVADFTGVPLSALNRETTTASYEGLSDPVTPTPNGECAIEDQALSTLTVACESDAAVVTVSFDFGEDP